MTEYVLVEDSYRDCERKIVAYKHNDLWEAQQELYNRYKEVFNRHGDIEDEYLENMLDFYLPDDYMEAWIDVVNENFYWKIEKVN